jgi:hypothetical protein
MDTEQIINNSITAGSTLLGVLIGAFITIISEKNIRKTDEEKQIVRKIYFPLYSEVYNFFTTQNAFRKEHDVLEVVSIDRLKKEMKQILHNNIEILDNFLFRIYKKLESEKYFEDFSGGERDKEYLAVFGMFMKEFLRLVRKNKILDKKSILEIEDIYYKYMLWFILLKKIKDWDKVNNILQSRQMFKRDIKKMVNSKFIDLWFKDYKIQGEYAIEVFNEYSRYEVIFPYLLLLKNEKKN